VATSPGVSAASGDQAPAHAVNIPIAAGDVIGVDAVTPALGQTARVFYSLPQGAAFASWDGGLGDGMTAAPSSTSSPGRLQLDATVQLTAPDVTGVAPASGPSGGGQSVTVTGTHLANASQVLFGANAAAITSVSNTQIGLVVPPGTAGAVSVTVTAPGGVSAATSAARYTYAEAAGSPGLPDTTPPTLSSFFLAPTTFVAANTGPSAVAAAAVGTHVVYRVSEAALTTLSVVHRTVGVRRAKGRRCRAGRLRRGLRRCARFVRVKGTFSHADAAGLNSIRFMGRLNRSALRPGRYRLIAVARDAAGNASAPVHRAFRIKH
jgi:hypothetical protein